MIILIVFIWFIGCFFTYGRLSAREIKEHDHFMKSVDIFIGSLFCWPLLLGRGKTYLHGKYEDKTL